MLYIIMQEIFFFQQYWQIFFNSCSAAGGIGHVCISLYADICFVSCVCEVFKVSEFNKHIEFFLTNYLVLLARLLFQL